MNTVLSSSGEENPSRNEFDYLLGIKRQGGIGFTVGAAMLSRLPAKSTLFSLRGPPA